MATDLELAVLANVVYSADQSNTIEIPSWRPVVGLVRDLPSGFAAQVFEKGDEVVIAFRGTDAEKLDQLITDFYHGNIPAGSGHYSDQVMEAIKLVADTQHKYGTTKTITLTGHSLGGGLASP